MKVIIRVRQLPDTSLREEMLEALEGHLPAGATVIFLNEGVPPEHAKNTGGALYVEVSTGSLADKLAVVYAIDEACIRVLKSKNKLGNYRGFTIEHLLGPLLARPPV